MHMRAAMVVLCLVAAAHPGLGASMKNHDDCGAGAPERVITACTRIIQDGSKSREARAIAHVHRGLARQHKGQRYKAMVDYTAAIRLNPKDPFAYSNRALLWHEKQDFDRRHRRPERGDPHRPHAALRGAGSRPRQPPLQPRARLAGQG